jgi:hypothetical protein
MPWRLTKARTPLATEWPPERAIELGQMGHNPTPGRIHRCHTGLVATTTSIHSRPSPIT